MEVNTGKMIMRTNVQFENGHLRFPEKKHCVDLLNLEPSNGEDTGFFFYTPEGKEICHVYVRTDRKPCELSYGTVEEFRGKGYMQEALKVVLQLFEDNHINDEISGLICNNSTSQHILEKLGFVQSGNSRYGGTWFVRK